MPEYPPKRPFVKLLLWLVRRLESKTVIVDRGAYSCPCQPDNPCEDCGKLNEGKNSWT